MNGKYEDFFLNPTNIAHKKYEALRALCVDKSLAMDVAENFNYSVFTVNAMKRDFMSALKAGRLESDNFFITKTVGRTPDVSKSLLKERIILLRKQNYSILDIKSIFHAEGNRVSHDYIYRVLEDEGFARLAKRTQFERKSQTSKILKAPRSRIINCRDEIGKLYHSERGAGILPFIPLLAKLGVDQWIKAAGYPETSDLPNTQNVLSFIALKLAGINRYSHDDLWAMDRGFGLFGGMNVIPKDGTLSSYSYRTNRNMNRIFLTEMLRTLRKQKLLTGQINMDFTSIPHWGDESVLETNWSGKYGRGLKSILSVLCQDPDTGIFSYSDAEIKHGRQAECVLEFVDFWKESGKKPSCLIFDSKFTTYENLEKLDIDNIQFITLRRRSKKLLSDLEHIQEEDWQYVKVEGPSRKHKRLKINDSEILLDKTSRYFRQIIVSDNGHEKESFIITNDRNRSAAEIVRQYGKRWNVEKGISEQIEFFHLNKLSSSIVVKVDFDLTMTVAAHNFYRIIAQQLVGYESQTSESLSCKFFNNGGRFKIEKDSIMIELKKKRHLQLLMEAISQYKNVRIPWLENRKLNFRMWATS